MLVCGDLDDIFLPKPNDLLINLAECRAGVEALLSRLNDMFKDNHAVGSALGAALQAAYKLVVRPKSLQVEGNGSLSAMHSHLSAARSWS